MARKKISVIGAGNVGSSAANAIAMRDLGHLVLWDIRPNVAKGRALDLQEAGPVTRFDTHITGTSSLTKTKNSDVIVFTAGAPRKKGMTREDLAEGNAKIIGPLVKKLAKYSPQATLVMVSNPLDTMTYLALKRSRFPKKRVFGMAGLLDSSRLRSFIAGALNVSMRDVQATVVGSHGEHMIPLKRFSAVAGIPVTEFLPARKLNQLIKHTQQAGAEVISYLGMNAGFSVGEAIGTTVDALLRDRKSVMTCSVYLNGEYGVRDVCIGVPIILGSGGVEKILKLPLDANEKKKFRKAVKSIKAQNRLAMHA